MEQNEIRRIAQCIGLIERIGRGYADDFLKERGVGRGQVPYLMQLYHNDGVSQDFLAKDLVMDKSTAARALQKLENAGLVKREQNPADKRENLVYLTEAGKEIHPYVKSLNAQWIDYLAAEIDDEQLKLLADMLEKMADRAKHYRQRHDDLS